MTDLAIIATISIFTAGMTVSFGALGPALGEGRAAAAAIAAIAQQPDAAPTLSRTLFVSLAMIESTAIYCFVVAMILIFANPFWESLPAVAGG
jgi:F-type H+-transporting ATPase subunit c